MDKSFSGAGRSGGAEGPAARIARVRVHANGLSLTVWPEATKALPKTAFTSAA